MEKYSETSCRRQASAYWREWLWVPSLYFAEGLPYAVVMMVSVVMYKRLGVDNSDIAFYTSWLYLPWVIKALWSPFVELASTRRRWVIAMQFLIGAVFSAVAFSLKTSVFFQLSLGAFWMMAFLSATHDIAADGFYMLGLDKRRQAWWVGLRSSFYRLALVAGQGGLVYMAGCLEQSMDIADAWRWTFVVMTLIFLALGSWHIYALPHSEADVKAPPRTPLQIVGEFAATFRAFFQKPGVWIIILFIFLYRFPEAQLVKLITPFLLDPKVDGGLGMSTIEVGVTYGVIGVCGLVAGGILGGFVASRRGLKRSMVPMAVAMSLSCVTFLYLSMAEAPGLLVIDICVAIEQFGYGYGLTAFTLMLLYFSDGPRRTSNYAICTGFMALGMMLPGMFAGYIQMLAGYRGFFVWTLVCCVATVAIAMIARSRVK